MRNMYLLSLGLMLALTVNAVMSCGIGQIKKSDGTCGDEDECAYEPNICGDHAACKNTVGSYYCRCNEGFSPTHNFTQEDGIVCRDINECVDGSADCGPNAECIDETGGYKCRCNTGYISSNGSETFFAGKGVQCTGVCETDKSICGEGGDCQNSKDECVCRSGFTNFGQKQVKCTELKQSTFISESKASQAFPELKKLVSLMNDTFLVLTGNKSAMMGDSYGERLLEEFMSALDALLQGDFQGDNRKVSAMFDIVENMLKLTGPLLSKSPTKRSSTLTEVELLVKRGSSKPEGDFSISNNKISFASHWDTATGNTYLGFTTAALLSYKGLEKALNHSFDNLETQKGQTFKINSRIVTATVSNTETASLKNPVTLTFTHLENTKENHICVFWDPNLNGGTWSKEGCTMVNSSHGQTVCSCNHLSSFAVLMALYDIGVCSLNHCHHITSSDRHRSETTKPKFLPPVS